jgi:hypothetical protein
VRVLPSCASRSRVAWSAPARSREVPGSVPAGERRHLEWTIASLRRFKDDVREVQAGFECGIGLENYQDLKAGDVIETYDLVEIARV